MASAEARDSISRSAGESDRLRVFLVTEEDPLYVVRFFEVFFQEYPSEELELIGITICRAFHESLLQTARRMMRFYGWLDFLRLGVRFSLAKLRGTGIRQLARRSGVAVIPTPSVNEPEYVERLRRLAPDVIASVAAPEIFRKAILAVPKLGCINIHSGRLPEYRGMMPNFWQLLNGEPHSTVTVHKMAPKLDAGDVLGTLEVPLQRRDSLHRVMSLTKREGGRLMIRVLRQLAAGTERPQPLDMDRVRYYSFPGPEDVARFRCRGHCLLP